ncbi:Zn(2)-C6 fungal-type domain-containing protein [Trichophyton interdigitale]|nr:Zn(2)-C6 fungal-type domain-containing protein [Trichophyton interdigitale]KAG5217416.1 Zn(2)-C6 fungal-type domain-containing protein [Trichophyton interdigitale]KAG8205879.1 Zn(2)-C6 fungal-type domain-containing protein [Trichophyton interdigitale]
MTKSDILGSSQVGSGESDQPARASNACESCRRRKKKCDRISPTCSSCRKHLLQCSYPRVSRISQLKVLRERLQVLENAISTKDSSAFTQAQDMEIAAALITASSIQEIELPQIYPVESQWYMPELLRFYSESIALQSQGDGSFTQLDTLQNIWMITALADECMFHATLYAASAYLDLLRGQSGNVITLYHQTETLRLLNGQLAAPNLQVTDALIAVTMVLTQTEALSGNVCVSSAHRAGLHHLVKIKGGPENLGMDGLLAELIYVGDAMDCLLFGTEQSFQWTTDPTPPPMALLSNVISWETFAHKTSPTIQSSANVLGLVQQSMLLIDHLPSASMENGMTPSFIQKFIHLHDEFLSLCRDNTVYTSSDSSAEFYINECCRQAALLHWRLVNDKCIISIEDPIPADGKDLKVAMGKMDIPTWSKVAPRAFIWAGVTGAAASKDYAERAWFAARLGPVVMAQGKNGIPTLKQGMALYQWLKAPVPMW